MLTTALSARAQGGCFPLHHPVEKERLRRRWMAWCKTARRGARDAARAHPPTHPSLLPAALLLQARHPTSNRWRRSARTRAHARRLALSEPTHLCWLSPCRPCSFWRARYFGEKIALYFAWLGHYTIWLVVRGDGSTAPPHALPTTSPLTTASLSSVARRAPRCSAAARLAGLTMRRTARQTTR